MRSDRYRESLTERCDSMVIQPTQVSRDGTERVSQDSASDWCFLRDRSRVCKALAAKGHKLILVSQDSERLNKATSS